MTGPESVSQANAVGEVRFATPLTLHELELEYGDRGWLVAEALTPTTPRSGQLAAILEDAVERSLQRRHAPPPGVGASADLNSSLSDQLYRARASGAGGLCLTVPPLFPIADATGSLSDTDSSVLRWWMAATTERPVSLLLDTENRHLGIYGPPVPLRSLLEAGPQLWRDASSVNPAGRTTNTVDDAAEPDMPAAQPDPSETPCDLACSAGSGLTESPPGEPLFPQAQESWPQWVTELRAAHGPKPLSAVERLFTSTYVPLSEAVERGIAGTDAQSALSDWAESFEQSYVEAFEALRLRSKRPTMVLDAPDLCLRIARLHGARSTQLVLVDGMRFDIGLRINQVLHALLGQRAALTERMLLWSALPSTTSVQLDLIGRGPDGLQSIGSGREPEVTVARGRGAATVRRVKAGPRELLKLDIVESQMAGPGPPLFERLHSVATAAAESLANHLLRLPPRTLVLVFGDHGFVVDRLDSGSSGARHGNARPEEVLVPAFAWLVGSVH